MVKFTLDEAYNKRSQHACMLAAEVIQNTYCPLTFVQNRIRKAFTTPTGHFGIDDWQKRALTQRGDQHFLCARQSGKSTTACALALWRAVHYDDSTILLLCPTEKQGKILIRRIKSMHRDIGSYTSGSGFLGQTSSTKIEFQNGSVIECLSTKNPDNIRGSSPVFVIEDEASWVSDEAFSIARPMLGAAGPDATYLMMSTPGGKSGHYWKTYSTQDPSFTFTKVIWTECPRIDPDRLEADKRIMTPNRFRREYHCEFMPGVYQLFSEEMLEAAIDKNGITDPMFSDEYFGFVPEDVTAAKSENHLGLSI